MTNNNNVRIDYNSADRDWLLNVTLLVKLLCKFKSIQILAQQENLKFIFIMFYLIGIVALSYHGNKVIVSLFT